ncbi:MAG: ParA family protein [Methylococcaceae bacterium]|nr:ParA family protein [Methylococcaceae bacterium]
MDSVNRPSISFVRFLEAVHYPPALVEASIQYCAAELRKSSITLNGNQEIFVLPACVDPKQPIELLDTPVLPEHLARNPSNPWRVGDAIEQLATELKADCVLIDLRAGLSELSSPLLFDPRIERFIVSTIAPQSVNGAVLILEKMALLRSSLATDIDNLAAVPTVILSLLTQTLRDSQDYDAAIEKLLTAFPPFDEDDTAALDYFIDAGFSDNLMCIRDITQALALTKESPLFSRLKLLPSTKPPLKTGKKPKRMEEAKNSERSNDAKKLAELCERYIYAERGEGEKLLITDPLRNLAKHYQNSIPNTLSIGAKGAGKTFNFLQLCRAKTWEDFLKKLNTKPIDNTKTLIFPFLVSKNLGRQAEEAISSCRKNCFQQLGLELAFSDTEFSDRINNAGSVTQTDWATFWTTEILRTFNPTGQHLNDLNQLLADKNLRMVILIDGLEDQFPTPTDPIAQKALETLLRFPDRFKEIRESHLGLITFVRADYVRAVIQQNAGQFEDRYKAFALEWTAESFLRLAHWICAQTGLSWAKNDSESLSSHELLEKLEKLWGQKLGSVKSKEAFTARWVFAVLCDLNGRLQARDLVRFMFYAATESQSGRTAVWDDRVLFPAAIRSAVEKCSAAKVEEAILEIEVLNQWSDELKKNQVDRSVPFDAQEESMGLPPERLKALQDLGVIFEDRDKMTEKKRFYLPESYRSGLGFTLTSTGRSKVLAIIKRNLKLPF